ncbi:STAS domain-containing protein [Actinomadura decatromicini]|uniref:Anti-sigma factor antagonist n=1 Tax=Actinomadura decatromicini TaxID=2604572 RepID=A0A5D3FSH2_9ACTN|nr:STAS domain-containing protein [Actinomadura decatromicini]TYK51069.1 STAS domain-containing protein [Actinomadura decatromicini]
MTTPTAASAAASPVRVPDEVGMPAHPRPGHTIIALSGTVDGAAAPALRAHLLGALRRSGRLLILDLGEVASADAAGLAVLVGIRRRAAGLGIAVLLAAPGPQVAELLRVTGLDRVLTVHPAPDVHAGLAA